MERLLRQIVEQIGVVHRPVPVIHVGKQGPHMLEAVLPVPRAGNQAEAAGVPTTAIRIAAPRFHGSEVVRMSHSSETLQTPNTKNRAC